MCRYCVPAGGILNDSVIKSRVDTLRYRYDLSGAARYSIARNGEVRRSINGSGVFAGSRNRRAESDFDLHRLPI
jgi:hypothetical protein